VPLTDEQFTRIADDLRAGWAADKAALTTSMRSHPMPSPSTRHYQQTIRPKLREVPGQLASALVAHRRVQADLRLRGGPTAGGDAKIATQAFSSAVYGLRQQAEAMYAEAAAQLRHTRRDPGQLGVPEQMAWQRLEPLVKAAVASPAAAWPQIEVRLLAAIADGDTALLTAARAMLPDALAAGGQPLAPVTFAWLDTNAGDDSVKEAVLLDAELERGMYHLRSALAAAEAELVDARPIVAPALPTFDAGVIEVLDGLNADAAVVRAADAAREAMASAAGIPYTPCSHVRAAVPDPSLPTSARPASGGS